MEKIGHLLCIFDKSKRVSTDSRKVSEGQIYFALKGENFDGNAFALDALENGALLAVVDDPNLTKNDKVFLVDDVLKTLQHLATQHRLRFDIPMIAITGTNGKTSTKELLHSVLGQALNVHYTGGNFNNHIGLPLTLLQLNKQHDISIIEMGASSEGEIKLLCDIARPSHGLITNIGTAHIEGFGSVECIARTKSELYDFLHTSNGIIFMPESLRQGKYFKEKVYDNVIHYSPGHIEGKSILSATMNDSFPTISIEVEERDGEKHLIHTSLFGDYNFMNIVNTIKIADYFNLNSTDIKKGIESYQPSNNRSQIVFDRNNNTIILDAYNANPSSVEAALNHFLRAKSNKSKVIILGDMLELGEISSTEHLKVINDLSGDVNVKSLFVGQEFIKAGKDLKIDKKVNELIFFKTSLECKDWWEKEDLHDHIILVKGSRGIALENIFSDLVGE